MIKANLEREKESQYSRIAGFELHGGETDLDLIAICITGSAYVQMSCMEDCIDWPVGLTWAPHQSWECGDQKI